MQDNRLQLIAEVKTKMDKALEKYYKVNSNSQEEADAAHAEYQKYLNEYHDLTGEAYVWE